MEKGYAQEHSVDYSETFSPLVKMQTIRILLTMALNQGRLIKQLDVSNAFLHGTIQEQVYMLQPQGFIDTVFPDYVCLLNESIYGLK